MIKQTKHSEETKIKIGNGRRGKLHSEESKKKISEGMKRANKLGLNSKGYFASKKLLEELGYSRKEFNDIKNNSKNFTPYKNISIEEHIDIKTNEGGSMILDEIKEMYKIKRTIYGNCVIDVNFVYKKNKNKNISIVFKKSDISNPLIMATKEFADIEYKHLFIHIANQYAKFRTEFKED